MRVMHGYDAWRCRSMQVAESLCELEGVRLGDSCCYAYCEPSRQNVVARDRLNNGLSTPCTSPKRRHTLTIGSSAVVECVKRQAGERERVRPLS